MMSDDVETAQTIAMMDELADRDAPTRTVIEATQQALTEGGIDQTASAIAKAQAIFWYLKRRIRYVHVPGTSPLVDQTLIPPQTMLRMPAPEGDCAQFSMCGNAMLKVCCVDSWFKTIAADPDYPETYSHVYLVVGVAPSQYMPFDASNGPSPGAEYARRFKERVWPSVTGSKCKEGGAMLRNTARRATSPNFRHAVTHRAMRGLFYPLAGVGDLNCDQDGNCFDTGTNVFTPAPITDSDVTGGVPPDCAFGGVWPNCISPSTPFPSPVPAASGGSLAQSIAADFTALAAPLVRSATQQRPYYIAGPNGQAVLYNPNTGTTGSSISASLSSLSPVTLGIGALLLVGLLALGGRK
jgi:hypothetical protein